MSKVPHYSGSAILGYLGGKLADMKFTWLASNPAQKYQFSSPYYKISS